MKNTIKIITINFFIFFSGVLTIELIFGSWFNQDNYGSLLIPKNQTNIIDNFPYKSNNLGIFTRDKNGFRANNYNLSEVDILVIGGSTTEEREVDDNLIWTKIFEKNLNYKFKVLNAGIGGQTSYGHKLMYSLWFSKFNNLNPKFILVYLGINDALNLIESIDKKIFEQDGRTLNLKNKDLLLDIDSVQRIYQYMKNNSIFHKVYLIIKGNLLSRKYNVSYNSEIKYHDAFVTSIPKNLHNLNDEKLLEFENYYFDNLNSIKDLEKIYNAKLIFITQSVSANHWINNYLKKINFLTLKFCKINHILCFNLSPQLDKYSLKNNIYYDGIHTSPIGSFYIGKKIATFFNEYYDNNFGEM